MHRGAERSWKLRENRRGAPDDADGPLPPTPWCGWGLKRLDGRMPR
ncbi:MAG: hypothetical protein GX934_01045 [Burkholderiales bacterium]|nr:hypothetical protein [Burkholderiales bacterium]